MEAETGRRQLRPGRTHRRSRRVSRRRETGSSGEDEDDDEVEDDYAMNAAMCSNRSTSRYELEEGGDGENYFPFVMRRESVSREDVRARREMRWELERYARLLPTCTICILVYKRKKKKKKKKKKERKEHC